MAWTYTIDELATILGAPVPGDATKFQSVSTDTRSMKGGEVFFALSGENFDGNTFVAQALEKGAVAAVCGVANEAGVGLVVDDPLQALQTFATHHRRIHDIPVIAVTGSCGKTTVKDLIAALLATKYTVVKTQGNLNNEIGCPLSLLQIDAQSERVVLEMGANHTGEIARLCAIAAPTESAITMIGPAHLEGFGSMEDVMRAKGEIIGGLPEDGVFYLNLDDEHCRRVAGPFSRTIVPFGAEGEVTLKSWHMDEHGEMVLQVDPVGELHLPLYSPALTHNILLAVAVGLRHGVETFEAPMREALTRTARMTIRTVGPLEILDDSYNANPSSTHASIDALQYRPRDGRRMLAMGEMLELGDYARAAHADVGRYAAVSGATHVLAMGPNADAVVEAAKSARAIYAKTFDNHADLAAVIHAEARPGDVLLVKGSRGMTMEKVIEHLTHLFGGDDPAPPESTGDRS